VLKNAIDVGSRPYGKSIWSGKPAAVISVSPGAIGGFGANHHLRQSLVFVDMPCLQQPEAYVGGIAAMLDDQGKVKNDTMRDFLGKFMHAFDDWIGKNVRAGVK
jgi:chromate reductase